MEDQVYIVVNKKQEIAVLEKLEHDKKKWFMRGKATKWIPSKEAIPTIGYPYRSQLRFPYVILVQENSRYLQWMYLDDIRDELVMYDGRKVEEDRQRRYYDKISRRLEDMYVI